MQFAPTPRSRMRISPAFLGGRKCPAGPPSGGPSVGLTARRNRTTIIAGWSTDLTIAAPQALRKHGHASSVQHRQRRSEWAGRGVHVARISLDRRGAVAETPCELQRVAIGVDGPGAGE